MKRHTEEEIRALHRALYEACGLPAITMGLGQLNSWNDFLSALEPLGETAGGLLSPRDISEVVGHMRRENRDSRAKWSLRPSKILRDPEAFLDLVLLARQRAAQRPPRPSTRMGVQESGGVSRQVELPAEEQVTDVRGAIAELRKNLGGKP